MPFLSPTDRRKKLLETPLMFSRLIVAGFPIDKLLSAKALIVGAGGLGVIVSEILARTGLGELHIVDRDVVKEENFNRLGYNRADIGKPKAMILAERLLRLRNNPSIPKKYHISVYHYHNDIIGWEKLEDIISSIDIIFSCTDNELARREINFLAMKYKKPMIDGATSIDGLRGTIITVIPCRTPCFECYYGSQTSIKVNHFERIGQCDASIATTMSIVAALQADQGLKVLLNYGKIHSMVKVDLRESVSIVTIDNVKPRDNCPIHRRFCDEF